MTVVRADALFRVGPADGFQVLVPRDLDDVLAFGSTAPLAGRSPVRVQLVSPDDRHAAPMGDFPWLSGPGLATRRAIGEELAGAVPDLEMVELDCDEADLVAVHTTAALDVVDLDRSNVRRFDDGVAMELIQATTRPDVVIPALFRQRELERGWLFAGRQMAELVRLRAWQGLVLHPIPRRDR